MIKPSDELVKVIAVTSSRHPEFKKFFQEWYMAELTKLPNALNNTGVQQGRAQVLTELMKLIEQAPEIVAERRL